MIIMLGVTMGRGSPSEVNRDNSGSNRTLIETGAYGISGVDTLPVDPDAEKGVAGET